MLLNKGFCTLLINLFIVGVASLCFAGVTEGMVEVNGYVGGLIGIGDAQWKGYPRYVGGSRHDVSLDPTTGTTAGLRLGYDITPHIGGELGWGLSNNDINKVSKIDRQKVHVAEIHDYEASLYGNLMIHFMPEERLVPFLTGGIGMIYLHSEDSDSQTRFAWNAGAGIKIFLNRRFAFRADVRNFNFKPKNTRDCLNFLEVSGGLTWYFDGEW